jgi:hypothetical protein
MEDRLATWEFRLFKIGLFILFVVSFGDYLFQKLWPIVRAIVNP